MCTSRPRVNLSPMQLYDSLRRAKVPFETIKPGEVSMYVCGATVQAGPHVGHMRAGVVFDTLRRWLEVKGLRVTFCRNITDIDDKIINSANERGVEWWRVVEQSVALFNAAYQALNVLPPTVEPRATAHVPEIELLIRTLIDRDAAYVTESGSVYLRVNKVANYGALSGQKLDGLQSGEPTEWLGEKQNPLDFALWKASKPGEPSWPMWVAESGRPGWHIECTAMAVKYLGDAFDIHGGGLDLTFPHHENELAQANVAGMPYANIWMHNGLIQVDGQKMGKSLGNSVTVDGLIATYGAPEFRYYLLSPHYRSPLNYSTDGIVANTAGFARVREALIAADGAERTADLESQYLTEFSQAMDDDMNTPRAFAALQGLARDVLSEPSDEKASALTTMAYVLGLDVSAATTSAPTDPAEIPEEALNRLSNLRGQLRAKGSYEESDEIRDVLAMLGETVRDTKA